MDDVEVTVHWRRPNPFLLALTLLVGSVAGVGSAVVILEEAWLFLPVAIATSVSSSIVAWRHRTLREGEPSYTERLICAANVGIQDGLVIALISVAAYGLVYSGTWVIDRLGWLELSAGSWGFWTGAAAMVSMSFFGENKQDCAGVLFPETPGHDLPYRQAAREGRYLWWVGIGLAIAVVVACVVIWGFGSVAAKVVWTLAVLLGGGAAVPEEAVTYEQSDEYDEIVQRLADALDDGPFETVINPITGDESVDQGLREADIFAQAVDRPSLLVDAKLGGGSLAWKEATPIITAAVTLQRWLENDSEVEPVLVLVDASPDEGLVTFARDATLHMIEYHSEAAEVVTHTAPAWMEDTVAAALAGFRRRTDDHEAEAGHG